MLAGSTWTGTLHYDDSDWFKIYAGRRTRLAVTVLNTSRRRGQVEAFQLVGRENRLRYSYVFHTGQSRTLTRTVKRGTTWVHVAPAVGYGLVVPASYEIKVRSSSKLLDHRP
jgi:hypothetical protein